MAGSLKNALGTAFRAGLRISAYCFVVAALAVVGYLVYLDRTITTTFEGRRWSVPAKVYAQPLELHPGRAISRDALTDELRRVGYAEADSARPGSYRLQRNGVAVHLRPFTFADGDEAGRRLDIEFDAETIAAIDTPAGKPVAYVRVEPPIIGSFYSNLGEDRLVIAPDAVPPLLTDTLKAVEDQHFDSHPGFDMAGIARAFWVNLKQGAVRQGGSTLTQQLVKSYFLSNERTLSRKLRELAMAVILEVRFEKADLLNAYVNEIYLGQDGGRAIHGFGLGSQFYLNKPLAELAADEIALLVAIIRGPSYYNPRRHPARARERRDLVLAKMHEFDLIDETELDRALAAPMQVAAELRRGGTYYPAFMDLVRAQLASDYPLESLSTEGFTVFTSLVPFLQDAAQSALTDTLVALERDRGLDGETLQGALEVRNSQTGEVEAVVGGRHAGSQGFNRALNARRQVGSLIKPVVYLAALETGRYHLATPVDDSPLVLHDYDDWAPENFDRTFHGRVPLVRALGDSLNVATVRVGLDIGVERVGQRLAELTGLPEPQPYPAILLGALDLTPHEVGNLYATFAGGGFNTPALAVTSVLDETGGLLTRYPLEVHQIIAPANAGAVTRALQIGMQFGTGRQSRHADRGVAGKTGTSDDYRDSWFAAFDARHLAVVWVGRDDNQPHGLTGSRGALRVWDDFATRTTITPATATSSGDDVDWVGIDYESGKKVFDYCGEPVSLPLPKGVTLPRMAGCGISLKDFGERVRDWFKGS